MSDPIQDVIKKIMQAAPPRKQEPPKVVEPTANDVYGHAIYFAGAGWGAGSAVFSMFYAHQIGLFPFFLMIVIAVGLMFIGKRMFSS